MKELLIISTLFAAVLALLRLKVPLWAVMPGSVLFLGIASHFTPGQYLQVLLNTCRDPSTAILMLFLYMVSLLEKIMRHSGALDRMIAAMEHYIPGRRLRLVMMPAFLGFLASPGGAMFSAPFVEKAGQGLGLSGEHKTFINYWFRHLWEYSLPLYPAFVMAATILEIPIGPFFSRMFPCTLIAIASGVIFCLATLKLPPREKKVSEPDGYLRDLVWGAFPVVALLILVAFFHVNVALALALVLFFTAIRARLAWKSLPRLLKEGFSLSLLASVFAILLFKDALGLSDLACGLSAFLGAHGVPILLLFFLLPCLTGFLTGVTQAAVGIAFPLLLVMADPSAHPRWFCFAYCCAMIGVMLSPVHLCLILTAEYFKVDFTRIYRYMALPLLFVAGAAALLYCM